MAPMQALRRELDTLNGLGRIWLALKPLSVSSPLTIADEWERRVDRFPHNIAVVFEKRTLTYVELDQYANRVAHWAQAHGLKQGDTIALFMQNRPEYVGIWLGLSKVGVVTAMLNNNLQSAALAHCVKIADARMMLIGRELSESWATMGDALPKSVPVWAVGPDSEGPILEGEQDFDASLNTQSTQRPDTQTRAHLRGGDPALFIFTSGTTGLPKAARIPHYRALGMLRIFGEVTQAGPKDRIYITLPLYHATGGLCGVGAALWRGGSMVLKRKFSVSSFWQDCTETGATLFVYIGELCRYLVNQPPGPHDSRHRLRAMFGNGMRADVWERFVPRFGVPKIVEFYGSTEGNVSMINVNGKVGAMGRIPPYLQKALRVAVVRFDHDTQQPMRGPDGLCIEAPLGEPGEGLGEILSKKARFRFEGYRGDDASTQKKILRDVFRRGDMWFRTGDLMKQDAEGYFYFVDRIGDTFRWKGENVSTNEVSEAINAFPGVVESNVYGVEVPGIDGRAGMAAIVAASALDFIRLRAYLCQELPHFARPLILRMQPQAEITGTFKYRKVDLVKQGFDPRTIPEPMYFDHPEQKAYVPLTPALYDQILAGEIKV